MDLGYISQNITCPSISWSLPFPGQVCMTRFVSNGSKNFSSNNNYWPRHSLSCQDSVPLCVMCCMLCFMCHVSRFTWHVSKAFYCCCNFMEQGDGGSLNKQVYPYSFWETCFSGCIKACGEDSGRCASLGFAQTVLGKIAMGLLGKYFMNVVLFPVAQSHMS